MTTSTDPASDKSPSVAIVDDHGLLAQSLSFALSSNGFRVERCTELSEGGIIGFVRSADADVVLLDLEIGGELGSTVRLIPEAMAGGVKVIMLTGVRDRVRLAECVEAGASGIISKSEPFDELVDQVRHVATVGSLLSPNERDAYLADLRRQRSADRARLQDFEALTPRESQVLAALIEGQSADQIAATWVVSITTVRSQIRSLLQKLGVNSQLSAVAMARRAGWSGPCE